MIDDAKMLSALHNEMSKTLKNAEARGLYALDEDTFLSSLMEYLGPKNKMDLEYLKKEFILQFNKLPSSRRILGQTRMALFPDAISADAFYRKILRNVRVSANDPVRRESYRESYLFNAAGEQVSSYRALYPQNYDIAGSIRSIDAPFRHNPLAYGKLANQLDSISISNDEIQNSRLVMSRKVQNAQNMASSIRKQMASGEITVDIDIDYEHFKIIREKQDLRSYLKKMEEQIADYTRENLILTTQEYLSEAIIDMIFKGKPPKTLKPKVNRVTASGKEVIQLQKPKATITKAKRLRVGNAQLDSAQVVSYINRHISKYVRRYMGTEGALVWRTGRFANSVKATRSVMDTRMNSLYIYTTYMYSPYATFAKGGKQHTPQREPQKLINRSVRALMQESFQSNWRLYVRDATN